MTIENIEINKKYNSVFSQNNIEEQIQQSPIDVIVEWHNKNILKIGNENKLVINILDASITKNEIENAINHDFKLVSLGKNRLRAETAGIYSCAAFSMIK